MRVKKRDGSLEPVDLSKIVRAVERASVGIAHVDPMRVVTRTISGLCDGATTTELDELSIRAAAGFITEEPGYSRLAARLLATVIAKEVRNVGVTSFTESVAASHAAGLVSDEAAELVRQQAATLDAGIRPERDELFELFGLRTLYDRYLLRHPETRAVLETPQYFFLRVACGLADDASEALQLYEKLSLLEYMLSSPTLFNSATTHPQMSSCYLLDSPADELDAIYARYGDVAKLSKHAGGIGVAWSRIRSRGSLIRGTNGMSNGIVPFLRTLDSSVAAVNQGGRRKGAACVYLETWHADIEEFLELRDSTGDVARRTHNINLAHWVPDLFMERVEQDALWSLFDPKVVPELCDTYGAEFAEVYEEAERAELFERQVPARQLYGSMMRTLAQTGNGWMTFKDPSNLRCNQTGEPGNVVHLSNLCTEIVEVTSGDETAVCNLGSINLARLVDEDGFRFDRLGEVVMLAVTYLDRVIDRNFYPTEAAKRSNARWRPVGLGVMGLQDVFFRLRMPFDSDEARALSRRIAEEIYFHALWRSTELAEVHGPHPAFAQTRAASGKLQCDLWGSAPRDVQRFDRLRKRVARFGLRHSLLIAIAPTATIASIAGCYECIEPQVSNLFKRETLSGEFLQVNSYLVEDLRTRGLWTDEIIQKLRRAEGSLAEIAEIPEDLRALYRTAWEIPMRSLIDMAADRGPWIDQSQSLNLFVESPTIGKLSSMYLHAWKRGLKTTYYLRSRPATRIAQTVAAPAPAGSTQAAAPAPADSTQAAVACSLENPETCEACQ